MNKYYAFTVALCGIFKQVIVFFTVLYLPCMLQITNDMFHIFLYYFHFIVLIIMLITSVLNMCNNY